MDFFENALNTAKEALEIVSQKTEEVVTTGKQKYTIASLKNKNSKCFESLGRIYFEQLLDTNIEDDETRNLVNIILQNEEKIAQLQEELNG